GYDLKDGRKAKAAMEAIRQDAEALTTALEARTNGYPHLERMRTNARLLQKELQISTFDTIIGNMRFEATSEVSSQHFEVNLPMSLHHDAPVLDLPMKRDSDYQRRQTITENFINSVTYDDTRAFSNYFGKSATKFEIYKYAFEAIKEIQLFRHEDFSIKNQTYSRMLGHRGFATEAIADGTAQETITKDTTTNKFANITNFLIEKEHELPNHIKELCSKYGLLAACFKVIDSN
ncbi:MAG TPA: hypothetical protein VHV10_11325, partial [Ktedonobacteraceae bacterium]|nr:hypothetical protein [Ktedonobacteraceae bacterium]